MFIQNRTIPVACIVIRVTDYSLIQFLNAHFTDGDGLYREAEDLLFIPGHVTLLLNLTRYSDTASALAQSSLSFPRMCLALARNPESSAWTDEKDRDSSHGSHARE
jgi:hypothetical protein